MRRAPTSRLIALAALLALAPAALAPAALAQTPGPTVETGRGPVRLLPLGAGNDVRILNGDTGTLYAGPQLVAFEPDGSVRFPGADRDVFVPPATVNARVFSLDARGQTVWVGLGFSDTVIDAEEPPQTAAGFAVSTDGGRSFRFRPPATDESTDTTVRYGRSTLRAVPTLFPQNAQPLDIAIAQGDTVYAATVAGGLRRTTNGGQTWTRVVLPPDSLTRLDPRRTYDFPYEPGGLGRPDSTFPTAALNFAAIALLYDEAGTLWVGTLSGLNRSVRIPGEADPAWIRYLDAPFPNPDGSAVGPLSNQITAIAARPNASGRDDVWIASVPSEVPETRDEEEAGVVVWRGDDADGFALFEPVLVGVTVLDIAFEGDRAYAASPDGLYVSGDDGASWRVVTTFPAPDGRLLPVRPGVRVASVASAASGLYVGTADGLLRSRDGGQTWELLRASPEPGRGRTETARAPDVEVYAYPNPFVPKNGELRIRLTLPAPADVRVRVFDTTMSLVRTLEAPGRPAGANELAWDGLTDDGLRASNGAYVYVVDAGGRTLSGRVLVLN